MKCQVDLTEISKREVTEHLLRSKGYIDTEAGGRTAISSHRFFFSLVIPFGMR